MRSLRAAESILVLLAAALPVFAADVATDKTADAAGDAAVRQIVSDLEARFNRGDAEALAALWELDGDFIGPAGERIIGRKNIETAFREFFSANKDCKLRLAVVAWRPLTDDVALVDAAADMTPAPKKLTGTPRTTILLVRREGKWLIDSVRETVGNVPAPFHQLKELSWMTGDWTAEIKGKSKATIRVACDWTANGSFLIRKFSVERPGGGSARGGTEIIGFDPQRHRIRSWVFESDGGFGESEWTHEGDQWILQYRGTLADGGDLEATHVITRVDADTLKVDSIDRFHNGERQSDADEIFFRRAVPPEKKAAPVEPPRQVLP